jgi:ubiquinone/menaquinone biosynthesis C-methylase UbiE
MGDAYHLEELQVARDPSHPGHRLPPAAPVDARILDIGCGAGQTLIAAYPDRVTFGLDCDRDALRLGRTLTDSVRFACGQAEALPYRDAQFDFVVARVSLAYTDISRALREIRRVLRKDGTLWMMLHPLSLCWRQARQANWKGKIYFAYIAANGLCFHFLQSQFRLGRRYESFQTESGMRRALRKQGFQVVTVDRGAHFVMTARAN